MSDVQKLRAQVVCQHQAIVTLARAIAETYELRPVLYVQSHDEEMLEQEGARTLALMDALGDMLNVIDAATESDIKATAEAFSCGREMFGCDDAQL